MHKGIYLIMMTNTNSQKKTQGFENTNTHTDKIDVSHQM